MGWKDWPYWKRGGVIGLVISTLMVIPLNFTPLVILFQFWLFWILGMPFGLASYRIFGYFFDFIVDNLPHDVIAYDVIAYKIFFIQNVSMIFNFLVLGTIIGYIYGKIKSRNQSQNLNQNIKTK